MKGRLSCCGLWQSSIEWVPASRDTGRYCRRTWMVYFLKQEIMAEELKIASGTKEEKYRLLLEQVVALTADESDDIANMANVSAMIQETFGFWWTGFYRVQEETLVLGPFQGPLACTRIAYGRGVCGSAWKEQRTLVVPDVELFPGHIACSSASRSEIVVPVWRAGRILAVLDIDSEHLATFDETDRLWLERLVAVFDR